MKNKILLPILLLATMTMVACNQGKKSEEPKPGPESSEVQPVTSEEQPVSSEEPQPSSEAPQPSSETPVSSEDPVVYGVAINNKAQLTGEWYKGTTRDLDITLTPAANALQEIQKGNLVITSSNPEIVAITGLGMNALGKGAAKITVKYHDAVDTVDVNILSNSAIDKYGTAHEGTEADPFTNEDALLVAKSDKYEQEVYYVKGKVASFYNAPGSRTDGMVAYYLEPATAGGEKFEIYKCFKENGDPLTDDDIWVGGEATAYGAFTKYNNQYETSSAKFVKCEGNKPQPRQTISKTFAEVLAGAQAFADGADSYDYWKFEGYVTKRDGNNYWLTATKGEALVSGKSDEAHGARDIYTNGIELYNAGKVAELVAKLLEGAKVEVTMIVKNYHGTVENGKDLVDADVVVKEAGTAWSVPEPAVENKTVTEFVALENTKAKAYNVTATIKSWKTASAAKDKYGNMIITDGTTDLVIYGATATASALAWDNASSYAFTNPQDFLTNEVTAALNIGANITMKLIRADYSGTKQGTGIITNVQTVATTGIELDQATLSVEVGKTAQLKATLTPSGATGAITWESSAPAVATVADGVVTGVAAGSATITAKCGEFSATCAVTVTAAAPLPEGAVKATLNLAAYATANSVSSGTKVSSIAIDSVVTAKAVGSDSNTGKIYIGTDMTEWRFYKSGTGTLEITLADGYTLLSAVGSVGTSNYGAGSDVEFTVAGNKVSYNPGANFNVKSLEVIYKPAGETPATNVAMPWFTTGEGNQAIHFEGAGIWTWVKYDSMGFENFAAFDAAKANFVAAYESEPAATIVDKVVSDDNATLKYARVYIVLSAAHNTGKLTLTIPGADGKTYEGTLEFNAGALTKINGVAL